MARPPRRLSVVLYGRAGCHLCDEAEAVLRRLARTLPLSIALIDIESDEYLQGRYMLEIPVVTVDGIEVARAPISASQLEDALHELAKGT